MGIMKRNTKFTTIILLFLVGIHFTGCATDSKSNGNMEGVGQSDNEKNNLSEPDPVILKVHFGQDENFINAFIKPAEDEFSHITFEHVEGSYEELIVAETIPDILFHWNSGGYNAVYE